MVPLSVVLRVDGSIAGGRGAVAPWLIDSPGGRYSCAWGPCGLGGRPSARGSLRLRRVRGVVIRSSVHVLHARDTPQAFTCWPVKAEIAGLTGVEPACVIPAGTLDTNGRSFPAYYPIRGEAGDRAHEHNEPTRAPCPRLSPELWPEIAARAERESLRTLAAAYGVSHETIRTIVRRTAQAEHQATAA